MARAIVSSEQSGGGGGEGEEKEEGEKEEEEEEVEIRTTMQSSVAMQQGCATQPRQLFLSSKQYDGGEGEGGGGGGGGGGEGGDSQLQCSLPWQ